MTCDCSPWARCDQHEAARPKGCRCNGPFAASWCPITEHAQQAREHPERDPALAD